MKQLVRCLFAVLIICSLGISQVFALEAESNILDPAEPEEYVVRNLGNSSTFAYMLNGCYVKITVSVEGTGNYSNGVYTSCSFTEQATLIQNTPGYNVAVYAGNAYGELIGSQIKVTYYYTIKIQSGSTWYTHNYSGTFMFS